MSEHKTNRRSRRRFLRTGALALGGWSLSRPSMLKAQSPDPVLLPTFVADTNGNGRSVRVTLVSYERPCSRSAASASCRIRTSTRVPTCSVEASWTSCRTTRSSTPLPPRRAGWWSSSHGPSPWPGTTSGTTCRFARPDPPPMVVPVLMRELDSWGRTVLYCLRHLSIKIWAAVSV